MLSGLREFTSKAAMAIISGTCRLPWAEWPCAHYASFEKLHDHCVTHFSSSERSCRGLAKPGSISFPFRVRGKVLARRQASCLCSQPLRSCRVFVLAASDWLITQTNEFKTAIPIAGISNLISYNYMTYYNQYEEMEFG